MKRYTKFGISVAALGLTVACGNNDTELTSAETDSYGTPAAMETDVDAMPRGMVTERTTTNQLGLSSASTPSRDSSSTVATAGSSTNQSSSLAGQPGVADDTQSESAAMGAAATAERGNESSTQSASRQYIDYKVLDASGEEIGSVEELWDDPSGNPRFLAVKTSENEEMIVIPTSEVMKSQSQKALKVPYSASSIDAAPKFSREQELDEDAQKRILAYYQQQQVRSAAHSQGQSPQAQSGSRQQPAAGETRDGADIELKEEQLKVGKRQVQSGGVVLRKVVRTETVNQPVELRHEELVVERVPGSGEQAQNAQFGEKDVFIPLLREVPVVEKNVVVKEVVNVGKKAEQEQRDVNAQLREEELKIIRQGEEKGAEAAGAPAAAASGQGQDPTEQKSPEKSTGEQTSSTVEESSGQESTGTAGEAPRD